MAAYAAIAVGLINLRYQSGEDGNFLNSAALFIPGAILLALTFTTFGRKLLAGRTAAITAALAGALLLIYSFVL